MTELCELREEVSELKSSRYMADARLKQLEQNIFEKDSEIAKANEDIEQLKAATSVKHASIVAEVQLSEVSCQVNQCQANMKSAHSEVDRLLDILNASENEKNEKENQIKDLQDTIREYKQKFGTLKRQQKKEKQKNAHLLEEARQRKEDVSTDTQHLMGSMKEKEGRIEELEEALRESVKITAEREMLLMEQKMQIDTCQNKIEELQSELEKAKNVTKEYTSKLSSYVKQLEEKDSKLKKMTLERHKHLEEVFDMKQEALQAAICEKDANIALLEMTSSKKQHNMEEINKLSQEKDKLNQQLKELIQNRTKYLQERSKGHKRSRSKKSRQEDKDEKSIEQPALVSTEQHTKNSEET